ncbi:MAG: hypothetical protein IIW46_03265, partial [Bacteroidaceae bacterium]|nr:hypothetical protein [Bacteroidaceae bacterium]
AFAQDTYLEYSTVIPADVVSRFVGNKVKEIQLILPTKGNDPAFWIIDANTGEQLWMANATGTYQDFALLSVPCDWTVDQVRDLQVGYTLSYSAGVKYSSVVVPCARDLTWLYNDSSLGQAVYNYSVMPLKGWKGGYIALPIYCVTEGEGGFLANDIQILGVSHSKVEMGSGANLNFTLSNYGCTPVKDVAYSYTMGDKTASGTTGGSIRFLGSASFSGKIDAIETAQRIPLNVEITSINGESLTEENVAEGSITAIDPDKTVDRMVVMEEYTGAWCGWCPRGMVGMEKLVEEYPDNFIPIAVHANDIMQEAAFNDLLASYSGGFPGSVLNRMKQVDPYYGSTNGTPFGIDNNILPMMYTLTEAAVDIEGAEIDREAGKVKVTASATFSIDCNLKDAPYCFSYVITEDGVNGKDLPASQRKDYLQSNYLSGNSHYTSDPYLKHLTSMGSYIEVDFDHVARHAEDILGIAGSLSGKFSAGDKLSHTYEFALPTNIKDLSKCHLVALLVDKGTGEIVNAKQVAMKSVTAVESATAPLASAKVDVVAGGVQVSADDATVNVYTAAGALVAQQAVQGKTFVALNAGNYVVRVVKGNDVFVKKVSL